MKNRHLNCVIVFAVLIVLCYTSASAAGPETTGQWVQGGTEPIPWSVHSHMLPSGKAMIWPGDEGVSGNNPQSWDPVTGNFSSLTPPGYNLFCAGHTFLADGGLFVAGGHNGQNNYGLKEAIIYNSFTDVWTENLPDMNAGRWYPTVTILPNGDPLVVSGSTDNTVGVNSLPQVFQMSAGTWRDLTNAQLSQDLYPFMLLAPNGRVFNPGPSTVTRYLDTAGTGSWSFVGNRPSGAWRDYGSAVMYEPGKVITMGGGSPSTNTAEVIDLNQPTPSWRATNSMQYSRRQINALLLPDGKVLVTGGYTETGTGFNQLCTGQTPDPCVYPAELWDPATETWSTLASASIPRVYHSTTILLPDGRVMSAGGNHQPVIEIFSPPYLFSSNGGLASRPTITSAPSSFNYGESILVQTPDALSINKVRILRYSSTTHAFNQSQYINSLSFSQTNGGINVVAPPSANVAPPGPYMLFILNGKGVPSVSKLIQLGGSSSPPPLPDVIVTSVSYADGIFTSTVKNQGTAATPTGTHIGVGYFVDGVQRTWGAVNGPLAAGASVTIGSDGGPYTIPNGTHTITAYADDVNRFTESNETNNQLSQSITVGSSLPDVIVTSIAYANGIFTSTVKNQGTAATPAGAAIGVGYFVDGVQRTWGTVNGPLAAGASVTIGTNGGSYAIPTGTHTIMAYADDVNRFAESDETNNQLSQAITTGSALPDVIVTSDAYANGIFTSTVKNQGAAATPAGAVIGVGYFVDGVQRTWGTVNGPLAAGASATIGTNGGSYTIPTGTHTIMAYADDVNRFAESDETNNQLSQSITVP